MPPEITPKVEPAAPAPAPVVAAPPAPVVPEPAPVAPLLEPAKEPAKAETPPPVSAEAKKVEEVKVPPTPPPPKSLVNEPAKEPVKEPEKAKPKEPAVEAAPLESAITYEPFKLPEGFQVDEKDMGEFTNLLKEAKAPQETGQKFIDLYAREMTKLADLQQRQWQKTLDDWKNDTLADPLLGGNRFQTVLKRCGDVLNEFATPEFRQMLDVSGIGNHPEMFRFLNKVSEFVGEPKPKVAQNPAPQPKPSRAERRYKSNGAQQQT